MEKRYLVKLHNRAHEGYRRAQCVLSKGENELAVTDAKRAQLASDPRITILSVSDLQPETADPCSDAGGVVVSELVSGGVGAETVIPSHYLPVIDPSAQQPEQKRKPNRKKA